MSTGCWRTEPRPLRLIVAGGRDYVLSVADYARLDLLAAHILIFEVVSGKATGVDRCGEAWAVARGYPVKGFPYRSEFGRAGGHVRNEEMAQYANGVVLFPGGRGTANMHMNAVKHGLLIWDWRS